MTPSVLFSSGDVAPDRLAADRVEAGRRLVEEDDLRAVHERGGEVEAALHAAGVRLHAAVGGVLEVDDLEQAADALLRLARGHAVEPRLQRQQLAAGLEVVEPRLLQRDADAAADGGGLTGDIEAGDLRAARGGAEQRRQHADGGRLAGAVGAEEAEDLPLRMSRSMPSTARMSALKCLTSPCAAIAGMQSPVDVWASLSAADRSRHARPAADSAASD